MNGFLEKLKKFAANELVCMGSMLVALIYGIYYLDLYNPLQYSLSEIGRLSPPILFILWSVLSGVALFFNVRRMYDRLGFNSRLGKWLLYAGLFFLFLTFINMSRDPVFYWIHVATAILFAVFALASVTLALLSVWKKGLKFKIISGIFYGLCLIDVVLLAVFTQMALYEFIPLILIYIVMFFINFTEAFRLGK